MMPTQRLVVRVPYTDDNNDSRIFCSQGGQLRPSLLAWHGRPPREGEESTILLEGKNFSIHDTHVIAGGKPAEAVLVSRNVLQVTIAKEATPTPSESGCPLLDINVATPNGVSNHLLIKMEPSNPDRKPAEVARAASGRVVHTGDAKSSGVPAEVKPAAKDTPKDHSGEATTAKQERAPLAQDPAVVRTGIKGKGKKE